MRALFILFLVSFFPLTLPANYPIESFHVCTVASYRHPNLDKLVKSCEKKGITLEVLGMDQPFLGNGSRFLFMQNYVNTLKDYEIVMYLDDFDSLVLADKVTILNKFLNLKALFVISAEKTCYPCAEYGNKYPFSLTPFKYINTEGYMGYAGFLKKWFKSLEPIDPSECDQTQAVLHFAKNPNNKNLYVLDTRCELFLPLYGVEANELSINYKNKTVRCLTTGSFPCVVHTSDWTFLLWNKIYDRIIKN